MKQLVIVFLVVLASCSVEQKDQDASNELLSSEGPPKYEHVVIVVLENKDYAEIIGDETPARYINEVLKAEGANFIHAYGEEHFSQGNYYWLFSGGNHDIGFTDQPPDPGSLSASNLGQQLIENGLSFKAYAESLPEIGSIANEAGESQWYPGKPLYARKHVPWISFDNVPNGTTVETSSNLRFADFPDPSQYDSLPPVAFVIPNLDNDMHNCVRGDNSSCIARGDRWLQDNLDAYYQWAKDNNSLLVLTFDEDDDRRGYMGLTDPAFEIPDGQSCKTEQRSEQLEEACERQNNVVTIFAGAHIRPGDYDEPITHVNILRTLEAMYGLPKAGAQQPNAAAAGISDNPIKSDIFEVIGSL